MKVITSRAARRLLVRLDRGEELVRTLESLAATEDVGAAWVRGAGTLTSVQLDRHDQARRRPGAPEHVEGALELESLTGNVAMEGGARVVTLYASVARRSASGAELIAGRLRAARVFHAELILECFDDVTLERVPDAATGLSLLCFDAPAPASRAWTARDEGDGADDADDVDEEPDAPPAPSGVSWADVAAVSAAPPVERPARRAPPKAEPVEPAPGFRPPPIPERRRTSEEEFMHELLPEKGDYVQHRQFGLCRVDREDGDGLVIRLPSGVRKTIRLDFMEVGEPRQEGHKRVFPIRPRKR